MDAADRHQNSRHQQQHTSHAASDHTSPPHTPVSPLLPSQRLPRLQTGDRDVRGHDLNSSFVSPIMSRTPSIASDSRFSALSGATGPFPANPANVKPAAAYIALTGAVQVVSEHNFSADRPPDSDDDVDIKPSKEDVSFTPAALALINAFLDQLLYSFLSTAKSTSVNALRPAVIEILKNKLARDAIASATEELSDLLAGNDEDEDKAGAKASNHDKWDLELVWKRTRLRVMVYMRLGEMEDEDEERHVKEQALHINGEHFRFSSTAGLVSWSAAIFLTSVLEHVAEQTLQVAGSAAFARLSRQQQSPEDAGLVPAIIVDEQDAERIALNPALGRLWRSWRKTVRANVRPTTPAQHREIYSVISPPKSLSSPRDSFGTAPESAHEDEAVIADRLADHPPDTQYPEHILASNIRLPMGDALRDVDEIEVPGLARDPSDAGSDDETEAVTTERRGSFSTYQTRQAEVKALSSLPVDDRTEESPKLKRQRSSSVPILLRRALKSQSKSDATTGEESGNGKHAAPPAGSVPIIHNSPAHPDADIFIDNRKSLIDIKTLLAAMDGGFTLFDDDSTRKLETDGNKPASSASARSFNLINRDGAEVPPQPRAERQHMASESATDNTPDLAQIGVATTSDEAVIPERGISAHGIRSTPSPIHNLSRAASIPRSKYSPAPVEGAMRESNEPVSAVANVSQRDRPIAPSVSTLAALRESVHRASSPPTIQNPAANGVPKSATSDAQLKRQSTVGQLGAISAFSSQAQYWGSNRNSQQIKSVTQPNGEHSAVQRVPSSTDLRKQGPDLTSSTIRGPHDFDQLVQGEDVVKYTLTPESIRETPKSDAQALALLTGEVPPLLTATANKDNSDRRSARSQVTKSITATSTDDATATEKKRYNRWSITKPLSRNTSTHRKSGLMARDARVITESTRDFADFIRSTKPDKEPQIRPLSTSQSPRNSTNYSLPRSQSFTGDRTRSLTKSDIAAGYAPPVPSLPGSSKPPMQPKSAKANDKTSSHELITFIRDGPKQEGEHRISRSIAPFRNTMDSEQFNEFKTSHPVKPLSAAKGDGAGIRGQSIYSQTSTQPSTRASMNSRTPLVNGSGNAATIAHPAYSGQAQSLNALSSNPPEDVERKRYRNKDPYAIDFDDDEDVSALPNGKRGGESLAEFLRAADGTREGDSKQMASAASLAQARELRERAKANSRRDSYRINGEPSSPPDSDLNALPLSSKRQSVAARPTTSGRAVADRLGVGSSSDTKDLADFLRSSGPAPAPVVSRGAQSQSSAQVKDAGKEKKSRGFFSFFKRSSTKAKTAGRHADMP